ncbi:CIC11C00000005856 [Sungouiella intermedia]|uniref:CIC11C00000005856 n=1 Tax=Sungouiella intermedia TaxID=45354 RepID=A0A1L0C3T2_9ASCO|nr:CIC11C00000005856 [[Candida] intermedia]
MSEEKQGIMDKIKSSFLLGSRKHEKILRALYRAGRRKAILERGQHSKDTSSSSVSSSDEEELEELEEERLAAGGATAGAGAAYAHNQSKVHPDTTTNRGIANQPATGTGSSRTGPTGTTGTTGSGAGAAESAAGAAYSHNRSDSGNYGSSKGKVVTLPPRVNRQPLEQNHGGDFSNAKQPTELVGAGESGLVTNQHPHYDNDAEAVQGQGKFFDPQDTQGGQYGTKSGRSEDDHRTGKTVAGAGAAGAAVGALAGGVGRGDSGAHAEATHAQVNQDKHLKTKPSAYYEADKQQEKENQRQLEKEVQKEAYLQGKDQGKHEVSTSSGSGLGSGAAHSGTSHSGTDARETHDQNKSAYNKGGVSAVIDKLKPGNSGSKHTGSEHTGVESGTTGHSGHGHSGAGAGAAGAAAGAVAGSSLAGSSQPSGVHAGHPPSSKDLIMTVRLSV